MLALPQRIQLLPGMDHSQGHIEGLKKNLVHRRKAVKREMIDARHLKNVIDQIMHMPEEGESIHFVVGCSYEPIDVVAMTIKLCRPATIVRIDMSTLGFNPDNIGLLMAGYDTGKIGTINLMCSQNFAKIEVENYAMLIDEIEVQRGGRVAATRTHAKLILMEMSDGRCFSLEGSGNLRACKSVEQLCLTNDRPLLEFHRQWMDDFIAAGGGFKNDGRKY